MPLLGLPLRGRGGGSVIGRSVQEDEVNRVAEFAGLALRGASRDMNRLVVLFSVSHFIFRPMRGNIDGAGRGVNT